jgi:hypothetical protein
MGPTGMVGTALGGSVTPGAGVASAVAPLGSAAGAAGLLCGLFETTESLLQATPATAVPIARTVVSAIRRQREREELSGCFKSDISSFQCEK